VRAADLTLEGWISADEAHAFNPLPQGPAAFLCISSAYPPMSRLGERGGGGPQLPQVSEGLLLPPRSLRDAAVPLQLPGDPAHLMHPWLWPWSCCAGRDFSGVSGCPELQQRQRPHVVHGVRGCSPRGVWDGGEPPACARVPFTHLFPPGSNHSHPLPILGHSSPSLLTIPPLGWQVSPCPPSPCRVAGG